MAQGAIIIRFPIERVRRPAHDGERVFSALIDEAALDRQMAKLALRCTLVTALLGVAMQITLG